VPPSGGTATVQAASTVSPSATGAAIVTITAPPAAPVLSSLSPSSGTQGKSVAVTLTGANFLTGATISIAGSGVSATTVAIVSSTRITATFVIAATAATGVHAVTVTTSAGASAPQSFTVNPAAPPKPTLTSLAPNAATRGATVTVTLTGTNFTSPATVTVQGSAITVSNVTLINSTTITATFHPASTASRRSHNVSVTTPGGITGTLPFTIQ
jgi:hypothetical protein